MTIHRDLGPFALFQLDPELHEPECRGDVMDDVIPVNTNTRSTRNEYVEEKPAPRRLINGCKCVSGFSSPVARIESRIFRGFRGDQPDCLGYGPPPIQTVIDPKLSSRMSVSREHRPVSPS